MLRHLCSLRETPLRVFSLKFKLNRAELIANICKKWENGTVLTDHFYDRPHDLNVLKALVKLGSLMKKLIVNKFDPIHIVYKGAKFEEGGGYDSMKKFDDHVTIIRSHFEENGMRLKASV